MKILLLTNGVPYPPDSGPRAKTHQLIRYLATRHKVTLVSLAYDQSEEEQAAALVPYCAAVHTVLLEPSLRRSLGAMVRSAVGGLPYTIGRHSSYAMHQLVERLAAEAAASGEPFDLVHADQIVMAPYAQALPMARLLDTHNIVSTIRARQSSKHSWPLSWAYRHEAARLRSYERHICNTFEAVTAVTEEDRETLKATGVARNLTVIPIGIDSEALTPVARDPASRAILSLASPGWPPNAEGIAWFTRQVYPLVRRAVPDSHLSICGAQPTPELRMVAEGDPAIEVTGLVSPRPYLERAAVLIAPLRSSGGMRVMLIEALASGIPVVATTVACAELGLTPGEHLLVADTPSAFADAVTLLLNDHDLGERLAAAARGYALEHYDWRAVYPAVDHVYSQITAHHAPRPDEATEQALVSL